MPTYDYKCEECEQTYAIEQKIKDPPLTTCPHPDCCGELRRIITGGGGFILKTGGYHATDYKKESK